MRLFVAVLPPREAVEHLDAFLDVRREAAGFRWAPAEQFHVTLAFCPDVEERVLDDLGDRLERAAGRRCAFATRITGGGAFPSVAAARLLWAGLDLDEGGRTELTRAATGARAAANRAGAVVDGARFRAHLTLARLGRPAEVSNWVRLLDAYEGPPWHADALHLIASHLGEGPRNRPRYETLASYAFGA